MKSLIFGTLVLLSLLGDTSWGFDGNRKGIVLGGGLGFSPVSTSEGIASDPETNVGVVVQLFIGYAWNDRNMIVYESNASGYNNSFGQKAGQAFTGASWYHYFRSPGRSAFTTAGIGYYWTTFQSLSTQSSPDRLVLGLSSGLIIGGGYEFARHWQAGAYFSSGIDDLEELHVSILISAVAF